MEWPAHPPLEGGGGLSLRLPNMGLKGGSGSSRVCPILGVVLVFWP